MTTFGERVKSKRIELELSQAELGKLAGLSQTTISDIERGRNDGSREIVQLASALNVAAEWLTTGRPSPLLPAPAEAGGLDDNKYIFIPRLNVQAAAGMGKENHHVEVMETLAFRRDWLAKRSLRADDLEVYEAVGDSMSPYIEDGDVVLVHITRDTPRNGEVWVIWQEGLGVRVKRLLFRENGDLIIRSDNPDKGLYPDEIIPGHMADQVRTIGKMVWRGG